MTEVWKAFDTQLQRSVAVRLLQADHQLDPGFITRFEREARIIASLYHPNIVQIHEFHISSPTQPENCIAYLVMEYIDGQTLATYIHDTSQRRRFPPVTDLIQLLASMSIAIDYAHQKGIVHRNIKPAVILLDR